MEIITGYTGRPHITSEQDRDINIGIFGAESYVLPTGMQMEAEISSNNEIKIRDGVLMHQGCAASIKKNTYDSVTITNGSQGMKRIDLIVARYEKNRNTNVESITWKVLQGNPAESNPAVPDCVVGDIQAGDIVADMPMYKVTLDGLNIVSIGKVFKTLSSIDELNEGITYRDIYFDGYTINAPANNAFFLDSNSDPAFNVPEVKGYTLKSVEILNCNGANNGYIIISPRISQKNLCITNNSYKNAVLTYLRLRLWYVKLSNQV